MESYRLSEQDAKNLALGTLTVGAGLAAFSQVSSIVPALQWLGIAALVVLTRELGQRTVAEWMDAYVDVELSMQGASVTILAAMVAYLMDSPVLALFPLSASFYSEEYEQWGKSIDATWMKRQFWIVFGGLVALFLGWFATLQLGSGKVATGYILFTLFQLLPFDYEDIPTGTLDGAYILRWGGFTWLVMMGITVVGVVVTL